MRENIQDNNLFYTCSLIEYIARKSENCKKYVVEMLGINNIQKIYDLAFVYHSENIDKVSDEFIDMCHIAIGDYDITSNKKNKIPTHYDIGKVYKRLIIRLSDRKEDYVKTLIDVMTSDLIYHIDNYDSSLYYENPDYIYECYIENKII